MKACVKVTAFVTRDKFLRHSVGATIVELQGSNFSRTTIPNNNK